MFASSRSAIPCVVVAARDPAARLRQRQIQLVLAEFGVRHHFLEHRQHRVGALLQPRKAEARAGLAHAALDRRRDVLQLLVDLVAGLGARAARPHHVGGQLRQTPLLGRVEQIAGAHQRVALHQRQLMILQQEHAHAV